MRALVIGASGLVGGALLRALGDQAAGTYLTRPRPGLILLDASDRAAVHDVFRAVHPDVVFVPAAEPNVDWCETHPREARDRNIAPILTILDEADTLPVVSFSSDYVFDGVAGPYTEESPQRPLSIYGRIKAELEGLLLQAGHTVVRTTTVFGIEVPPAKNFVLRLIAALQRGDVVRIPNDQSSTPTYADDLARAVVRLVGSGRGVWHVAGPEPMPRTSLASLVCREFGLPRELIVPTPTADLQQPAVRPLRGGLVCGRYASLFGAPVRSVGAALSILHDQLDGRI